MGQRCSCYEQARAIKIRIIALTLVSWYDDAMIYALIDPRNNEVKYIGSSMAWKKRRYRQHIGSTAKLACLQSWLEELRQADLTPQYQELEDAPRRITGLREAYWMHQHLATILNTNKKLHWIV